MPKAKTINQAVSGEVAKIEEKPREVAVDLSTTETKVQSFVKKRILQMKEFKTKQGIEKFWKEADCMHI